MEKRRHIQLVLLLMFLLVFPNLAGSLPAEESDDRGAAGSGQQDADPSQTAPRTLHPASSGRGRAQAPTLPDIILSELNWSSASPDDGVQLEIFATVFNDGAALQKPFMVEICVDGNPAGSASIHSLPESGFSTARVPWTATSGAHEIRAVADYQNNVPESNETNNFRIAYLGIPYPDLVIRNVSWHPVEYRDGDTVTVMATVKNLGPGSTSRPFVLETVADQARLTNQIVGGLRANSSTVTTVRWTATSGNHTLFLNVDPGNSVAESNEVNNRLTARLGDDFPDLELTSLSVSPAGLSDGSPAALSTAVTNRGRGATTQRFSVGFMVDGIIVGTDSVFGLAANSSKNVSVSWKVLSGHHEVRAVADLNGEVAEAVESNNHRMLALDVPYPNLVVRDVRWDPALPTDGRRTLVNITVANIGNGSTFRTFPVDLLVDGRGVGSLELTGLGRGEEVNLSRNWTPSPGNHQLRAVADSNNLVPETNDTDNFLVREVSVPHPDLVLAPLVLTPRNPDAGAAVTLRTTVQNLGPGNTSRSFEVRFFAGGKDVGSASVDGLSRGIMRNLTTAWNAGPGTYDVTAAVDFRGQVEELDELNNLATSRFTVSFPDLTVTGMTWSPPDALAGQLVNLSASVRNNGANDSAPFAVGLFANGALMQSQPFTGIRSAQSLNANFTFALPANITVVRVEADLQNAVLEVSEADNSLVMYYPNGTVLPDPPAPDLTIKELRWFPENPLDGEPVSVLVTVNLSNYPSASPLDINVGCILDGQPMGARVVRILMGEGDGEFKWGAVPGAHNLQVWADTTGVLPELLEDNNWAFASLTVLPADIAVASFQPGQPGAADGDRVTVFCGLANPGPAATRADFLVEFFVDGLLLQTSQQSGLPLGATNTVMFTYTAFPGIHRLRVRANPGQGVPETNLSNNEAFSRVTVDGPDLNLSSVQAIAVADEGNSVTISSTLVNAGGSTVRDVAVAFFVDGAQIGGRTVSGLLAGKSATVLMSWTALPGLHRITAVADSARSIRELDEGNNWRTITAVNVSLPDLQVRGMALIQPPVDGAECLVSAELVNAGMATLREFSVGFYLDEVQMGTLRLGGVLGNSSFWVSERFTIPAGPHLLRVFADAFNTIAELDETNNDAMLGTNGTAPPDLAMVGLKLPLKAVDGELVQLFAEVENAGSGNTTSSFSITFFVDGLRVSDEVVEGLPAGGTASVSVRWVALPGKHYVRAVADLGRRLPEINETDNELHKEGILVEPPDITVSEVSSVRALNSPRPDLFWVFAMMENPGGATLRSIHARVLVDNRPAGDTSVLGLPAMSSTQISFSVQAASPHLLNVRVDPDGLLAEADESNNEASDDFAPVNEIPNTLPDLVVEDLIILPAYPTDGQPATVFATLTNRGNATILGATDLLLNVKDQTMPQSQNASHATLLGLLPGMTAIVSFPWTAISGSTQLTVVADSPKDLPEVNEGNNGFQTTVNVSVPDLLVTGLARGNSTEGLDLPLFAVIENNGTGDTFRTIALNIYIGGSLYLQKEVKGLLSGQATCLGIRWPAAAGETDMVVEVDPKGRLPESDEGNNFLLQTVYTRYPELSIGRISWTPHRDNESVLTVFVEVENTGTGASGRPFPVTLSVDSRPLEPGEVQGIPADSGTVVSWKWNLQPGNHTFSAVADGADKVWEPNENNNRAVVDFPSGRFTNTATFTNMKVGNLTFKQSRITKSSVESSGNLLNLTFNVQNDGLVNLTYCYAALLADGVRIKELMIPPLAANSSLNLTYGWEAPVVDHVIKVIVDSRREVQEDIETDNDEIIFLEGNMPPRAETGGPYGTKVGDTVTLYGIGVDYDGYIALYEWDLDGDGKFEYRSTVSGTVTKVFHGTGLFTLNLRITDDRGATALSSCNVRVEEKAGPPLIRLDVLTLVVVVIVFAILVATAVMLYRDKEGSFRR